MSRSKDLSESIQSVSEAKRPKGAIDVTGTHVAFIKFDKDTNGNGTIKLWNNNNEKIFSIQTNGNLPETHRLKTNGMKAKDLKPNDLKAIGKEVGAYIKAHGTSKMK